MLHSKAFIYNVLHSKFFIQQNRKYGNDSFLSPTRHLTTGTTQFIIFTWFKEIFLFKNNLAKKQTNSIYLGRCINTFFNDGCQTSI